MSVRPPKILPIQITSITPVANWTADDGTGDPYLNQPYRWSVTFAVTAQPHSYTRSPTPRFWTGSDIKTGFWIASSAGGIANQIISITSQSPTSVTCLVEDVDRYNTFVDPQGMGIGIGPTGGGFCFELGEDGYPILSPVKSGVLPFEFQVDLLSRFRHRNLVQSYYRVIQPNHGFTEGDAIYLKPDGTYGEATDAMPDTAQVIGIVYDSHIYSDHTADWFAYKPVGQVLANISPPLPGNPGDLIYLGTSGYTATAPTSGNRQPVFIRLESGSKGILLNRGSENATGGGSSTSDAETYSVTVTPASSNPLVICKVTAGSRVSLVTVEVTQPFDDVTASLTVGDDTDPSRLMEDIHNDLSGVDIYQMTPPYQYTADTFIKVFFDFKTSTTGSAKVTISYL